MTEEKEQTVQIAMPETMQEAQIVSQNSVQKITSQLRIMLKRNFLFQYRYYKSSLCQAVVAPILLMLLLLILQAVDYNQQLDVVTDPSPYAIGGIKNCISPQPCVNVLYTPDNAFTNTIMRQFNENNKEYGGDDLYANGVSTLNPTQDLSENVGIGRMGSQDDMFDFIVNHPNQTTWGVQFFFNEGDKDIRYQIWYNASISRNGTDIYGDNLLGFSRTMDQALLGYASNGFSGSQDFQYKLQLQDWPEPKPAREELADQIVRSLGPLFFFCMQIAIFLSVINSLSQEKSMRLRNAMEMMGLKPSVYFFTWFVSTLALVFVNSLVTCIMGLICGFEFFVNTDFSVLLVLYVLFGMAMVSLGFFISSLFRVTSQAILSAIFVIIIALFFQLIIFGNPTLGYIWWSSALEGVDLKYVFMFLPWFNFGKIYLDITQLTTGRQDRITRIFVKGPGYDWSSVANTLPEEYLPGGFGDTSYDVPASSQAFWLLFMNIVLFYILALYFDKVLPDEFGRREVPWFFLTPRFWKQLMPTKGGVVSQGVNVQEWITKHTNSTSFEQEDIQQQLVNAQTVSDVPIRILNLRKVYGRGAMKKEAVKHLSFCFPKSKLLALLGKNGAGKSTTMNIIAGLASPSSGDGLIYDYSVVDSIGQIQSLMGICPQFDLLFDDLTAQEHIELYAELKNVPKESIQGIVKDRLEQVRLWEVKDKPTRTYSGGMKRRLSMVIATIGDPKIVILDEPTTGMDPVNRRYVWQFIENFKENRVIILTSHSMEEADILGDEIAVMADGEFKAFGTGITLKNKYGAGYRINLVTTRVNEVKAIVQKHVPEAVLEDDSAGSLLYQLPIAATERIGPFVKMLEDSDLGEGEMEKGMVSNWGVSQTTLEEVFLKLIRNK